MKQHILAVGADPALLYTRGLLLERSSAAVTTASYEHAVSLLLTSPFDLLVLCHSLTARQMHELCLAAGKRAHAFTTLVLENDCEARRSPVQVDCRFALQEGPAQLILTVKTLLAQAAEAQHQGAEIISNPAPYLVAKIPHKPSVKDPALASRFPPFLPPLASGEGPG